tara:strand:- start:1509 stop:1715 length:207 start_codon:yes stop_codon:yes gene_type:complete
MNKARKIAIAGATGMVGQSFLKLLEKDYFQDSEISLLASSNSAGKEINFRGRIIRSKIYQNLIFLNLT